MGETLRHGQQVLGTGSIRARVFVARVLVVFFSRKARAKPKEMAYGKGGGAITIVPWYYIVVVIEK